MYTKEQWRTLSDRFNSNSFLGKLILIKSNPEIFYIQSDGYNIRLRLICENAMHDGFDAYFSFPEFVGFEVISSLSKLGDLNIKELK